MATFKACNDAFIVKGNTADEAFKNFHKTHQSFPDTIYLEESNKSLTPVWETTKEEVK